MSASFSTSNMAPDAVMQYALPDLLHITVDMDKLQLRRDRLLEALRGAGYQVHTPEGTFYLLVRSPVDDESAFVRRLAQDKVLAMSGACSRCPGTSGSRSPRRTTWSNERSPCSRRRSAKPADAG